ncbi:MAG: pyruvate kinase, partial [Saprospiraceae bacterium]|nr:pyruvate kinase [Saprospiraceae bacterium]
MKEGVPSRYNEISQKLTQIIMAACKLEERYQPEIEKVDPIFTASATNLIHYLAFRSFDIDQFQVELNNLGLPSLANIEGHVMYSLRNLQQILTQLTGGDGTTAQGRFLTLKKAAKIMRKNNKLLFGYKSKKRRTRIMVTLPDTAADDPKFVRQLISLGMNCARINCAHDDVETWSKMIQNVRDANRKLKKKCRVAMDLAGPKLRTGAMIAGPKVIHISPRRNDLGQVIQASQIWIAPPDIPPPPNREVDAVLPVEK